MDSPPSILEFGNNTCIRLTDLWSRIMFTFRTLVTMKGTQAVSGVMVGFCFLTRLYGCILAVILHAI